MIAGLPESDDRHLGPYRIHDSFAKIQEALGISLTQAANMPYYYAIAAKPFFGKPTRWDKAPHVFVAMPFSAPLKVVYSGPIKVACKRLKLSVERGDDIFSASDIVSDIWEAIYNAGAMVADCTDRNPNVFYEIGMADTLGTPVILISQSDDDIPFDVTHVRYIRYDNTVSGLRKLESVLHKTLKAVGPGIWSDRQID